MTDAWLGLIGSVIVGILTLLGVLVSNSRAQAVTETKLEELTREVRRHNNFAERIPVIEERLKMMDKRLNEIEKKEA